MVLFYDSVKMCGCWISIVRGNDVCVEFWQMSYGEEA